MYLYLILRGKEHPHVGESRTVLDTGFHVVDSGFQVLDFSLCQWNSNSAFQSLADSGFLELYSGFHKQKFSPSPNSTTKNSENPDSLHVVRRTSLISIFGKLNGQFFLCYR